MGSWNAAQPAPRAVWQIVNSNFPATRFLGIYVKRNVAGTSTPSLHAEGRALDIGLRVSSPSEKLIGDQLFELFIGDAAELGLDHVIWNRRIWSAAKGGPRLYTGVSPHTDHIHVAFTRAGSQKTTFAMFGLHVAQLRTGLEEIAAANRSTG